MSNSEYIHKLIIFQNIVTTPIFNFDKLVKYSPLPRFVQFHATGISDDGLQKLLETFNNTDAPPGVGNVLL